MCAKFGTATATLLSAFFLATSCAGATDDTLAFQDCAFEANRYIVCRVPPPVVERAIKSAPASHPGDAFSSFLIDTLRGRGCAGTFDRATFILNGVFFSIDSRGLSKITCNGEALKLSFSPTGISTAGLTFAFPSDE